MNNKIAIFELGFRPFFLLASIYSLFSLAYFILLFSGATDYLPSYFDPISWHQHEMIFGFVFPIIVGFLLTAVRNWTSQETAKHFALFLIVALWIFGRIAVFFSNILPQWLVVLVDSSFSIAAIFGIAPALIKSKNKKNFFFVAILLLFGFLNLATHLSFTGNINSEKNFMLIAIDAIMLIIAIVGGRVIPFFTERALMIEPVKRIKYIEISSILSIVLLIICDLIVDNKIIISCLLITAALTNGIRMILWYKKQIWQHPLLWILYVGYSLAVIGFATKAFIVFYDLEQFRSLSNHILTLGAISTIILGMMSRVSLGHTGRELKVGSLITASFLFMSCSVVFRVFFVMIFPDNSLLMISIAAAFWIIAMSIFSFVYAPILVRVRVDGKLG
jgi:uncharacterized protein involved in response to NO